MNNLFTILPRVIKYLPALAIGTTTTFFIIGLLIVNLRLSWFGIYSQEFARTEYILVGAVFVFLVATAQTSFTYSKKDFSTFIPELKEKHYVRALGSVFFGVITFTAPLVIIFGSLFFNTEFIYSWIAWFSIGCLILVGHITHLFITEFTALINKPDATSEKAKDDNVVATNRLLGQIAFLLIFVGMYSNLMYPHIPTAFGGGSKSPIMLYPTQRGEEISKALALPFQGNPAIVGPIEVLTESEKEIVVLVPDGLTGKRQAVRLNRELFDAIQTVTPKGHN